MLQNGLLYTGGEDRNITAWDINSGKAAYCIEEAHAARVKGIVVLSNSNEVTGDDEPYLVASASSDGTIRVWDVRMAATENPTPLAECKTKSRLTCLAGSCLNLNCKFKILESLIIAFPLISLFPKLFSFNLLFEGNTP